MEDEINQIKVDIRTSESEKKCQQHARSNDDDEKERENFISIHVCLYWDVRREMGYPEMLSEREREKKEKHNIILMLVT